MAIKDYWIYQKRDVPTPWALYVVKEYDRRNPKATMLDFTLYHEDVPTPTHSKSYVGLHYDTVNGYVDAIIGEIMDYVTVREQDEDQLTRSIEDILIH